MTEAHCGDCEWTVEETDGEDLNRAMIEHYVESGHSLVARGPRPTERPGERAASDDSEAASPF